MSGTQVDDASFVSWARTALCPLSVAGPRGSAAAGLALLGDLIGDATLVALGEGVHFAAEPLEFRNRAFQYLVQEKGYTAIAIESGIVEGSLVHDYVRGGAGDLARVMRDGISWTFDHLPQNADLVHWLRQHNADQRRSRKVNFYGFDISSGNPNAGRGSETALVEALNYLARVDAASGAEFHARLDALIPSIRFDFSRPLDGPSYERLSLVERDRLTAAIADLVALLERREARYIAASTQREYEWACRAAIAARQTDNFLRQIPPRWRASDEALQFLLAAQDVRDRAQADNLDWIVRQEGLGGKILVFAHNTHLSTAPYRRSWPLSNDIGASRQGTMRSHENQPAGTYLRRRFGDRLVTIGNLIGAGTTGCGAAQMLRYAPQTLDEFAGAVGVQRFLLDLRHPPASIAHWLAQQHPVGPITKSEGQEILRKVAVGKAFDILLYIDAVSCACPKRGRNVD